MPPYRSCGACRNQPAPVPQGNCGIAETLAMAYIKDQPFGEVYSMKMNGNSMNGMNGNMSQGAMFEAIRQVSFVMDELRLFLDTHPKDRQALEMFLSNQEMRHRLIADYTEKYGPIDSYFINTDGTWSWANPPMPWKAEAN